MEILPHERSPFSFRIDNLGLKTCIIKVKKIACKSLKGRGVNSGLRLIYAYFPDEQKITFVEIYHKNDKEMEDMIEEDKSLLDSDDDKSKKRNETGVTFRYFMQNL